MMNYLVFDAGPLITTCKFAVSGRLIVDHILDHCTIAIAAAVGQEVISAGARYPDAQAARKRIEAGQIEVFAPSPAPELSALLAPYHLGTGEHDSILLTLLSELQTATLVLDDHLAYLVSDRLTRRQRFLLDIIVDLVHRQQLDQRLALEIVRAMRSRYPVAFVAQTLLLLRR